MTSVVSSSKPMPTQTARPQRNYPITSITRLNSYMQCGEKYRLQYIEKVKAPEEFNPAFINGRYVHSVFEEVLDPRTPEISTHEAFTLQLPLFIEKYGLTEIPEELIYKVAVELGKLLYKASARYNAPDAIRTKEGNVPANVQTYPPGSWTTALRHSGVMDLRLQLDNMAANCNPVFQLCSFSYLIAETYSLIYNFQPPDYAETIAVELAFSTEDSDRIRFPGEEELSLNAYIDWVIRLKDNDGLVLLDHKTDDSQPTGLDVEHHFQLNMYAWIYEKLYGERPCGIGIHHVPSGKIIMAELNRDVQTSIINYAMSIQEQINAKRFIRRHLLDFASPCMKRDYKTKELKSLCPYFGTCWPSYNECLS